MITQVLRAIGLSEKEALVYSALLSMGEQPVSTIAKSANLNRTTCYDILENLIQKGIVSSVVKRNIKFFTALDPSNLFNYLNNIENDLKYKKDLLEKNISVLEQIKIKSTRSPKVKFFEGIEGMKQVYLDTLNTEVIYGFANIANYSEELAHFLNTDYIPKRINQKIQLNVLVPDLKEIYKKEEEEKKKESEIREIKVLPVDLAINIEVNIYNNKVAFMSFYDNHYVGIIIDNQEIYQAMLSMHKICWLFAKDL